MSLQSGLVATAAVAAAAAVLAITAAAASAAAALLVSTFQGSAGGAAAAPLALRGEREFSRSRFKARVVVVADSLALWKRSFSIVCCWSASAARALTSVSMATALIAASSASSSMSMLPPSFTWSFKEADAARNSACHAASALLYFAMAFSCSSSCFSHRSRSLVM